MFSIRAPASHYQSPIVRNGLRLFAIILAAVGVGMFVPALRELLDAKASTAWPSVTGTVRESAIEAMTVGTKRTFKPIIRYEYHVDGKWYDNRRMSFADGGSSNQSATEAIVAKYPIDKTVTVCHRPGDPQNAVLEPGASTGAYAKVMIFPAMIIMGVVLWRSTRAKRADDESLIPA